MKKLVYPACFYPCEDKPGAYTVIVPDLPGCISEGETLADAIEMGTDAASGWIWGEIEDKHIVPTPSDIKDIHPDTPDGFVSLLVIDAPTADDTKPVDVDVCIPEWLDKLAAEAGLDCSQILQKAIIRQLNKHS